MKTKSYIFYILVFFILKQTNILLIDPYSQYDPYNQNQAYQDPYYQYQQQSPMDSVKLLMNVGQQIIAKPAQDSGLISESTIKSINKAIGLGTEAATEATLTQETVSSKSKATSFLSQTAKKLALKTFGIQDTAQLESFLPIAQFLINLPTSISNTALNVGAYKERQFKIEQKLDNQKVTLLFDLQEMNINEPFGFINYEEKYYFNPSKAIFLIEGINEKTGLPKTTEIDLTNSDFSKILYNVLKLFKKEELYTKIIKSLYLYPADIFFFRTALLVSEASRNSTNNPDGYPQINHVPIELMFLLKKLSITPNYNLTKSRQSSLIKKTHQWNPDKIVFYGHDPEPVVNELPFFLEQFLNAINLQINELDYEKYLDYKNEVPSQIIPLVSKIRKINNYDDRGSFFLNNFININYLSLSTNDKILFDSCLKYHLIERYFGIIDFIQKFKNQDWYSLENKLDITQIIELLETRINKIATFIDNVYQKTNRIGELEELSKWLIDKKTYIQEIEIKEIKDQILNIANNHVQLINSQGSPESLISQADQLIKYLQDLINLDLDHYFLLQAGQSASVKFLEYFKIHYYKFQQLLNTRYRGDEDFLYDDLPLELNEVIHKSVGIIIRALSDLQKAKMLFKNDYNQYQMQSPNGDITTITGAALYEEKIANNKQFLVQAEKQIEAIKNSTDDPSNLAGSITKQIIEANDVYSYTKSLELDFMHYLRQYKFDRRDLSENNFLKFSQTNQNSQLNKFIKTNRFWGNNVYYKALIHQLNLQIKQIANILESPHVKFLEKALQNQLDNLEKLLASANQVDTLAKEEITSELIKQNPAFLLENDLEAAMLQLLNKQETIENKNIDDTENKEANPSEKTSRFTYEKTETISNLLITIEKTNQKQKEALQKITEITKQQRAILETKEYLNDIITKELSSHSIPLNEISEEQKLEILNNIRERSYESLLSTINLTNFILQKSLPLKNIVNYALSIASAKSNEYTDLPYFKNNDYNEPQNLLSEEELANQYNEQLSPLQNSNFSKSIQIIESLEKIPDEQALNTIIQSREGFNQDIILFLEKEGFQVKQTSLSQALENLSKLESSNLNHDLRQQNTQDLGYAQTVNDFLAEEFYNLSTRCREFKSQGNIFLDQILFSTLGISFDAIINSKVNYLDKKKDVLDLSNFATKEKASFSIVSKNNMEIKMDLIPPEILLNEIPIDDQIQAQDVKQKKIEGTWSLQQSQSSKTEAVAPTSRTTRR